MLRDVWDPGRRPWSGMIDAFGVQIADEPLDSEDPPMLSEHQTAGLTKPECGCWLRRDQIMSYEIIGIDHIYISVSDIGRSEAFYDRVMSVLGYKKNSFVNEGDRHVQYYNRHFGFVLRPAHTGDRRHDPLAPGLHHFCFRVEDASAVDGVAGEFAKLNIACSPPQLY